MIIEKRRFISLTLAIVLMFAFCISNIKFADASSSLDIAVFADNRDLYNGESIIFEMNGFICTEVKESNYTIIKTYNKEGQLIENAKSFNYENKIEIVTYDEMNIPKKEVILMEETISTNQEIENETTPFIVYPTVPLGRTTFSSKTSPYFRAMTVKYKKTTNEGVSYTVPNGIKTVGGMISFLLKIASWKSGAVKKVIDDYFIEGIISGTLNAIECNKFKVSANETKYQYWGEDTYNNNSYKGSIIGSTYQVRTEASKYYKKNFNEGIYFSPQEWGNGSITRGLAPTVYGGFYSNLTYKGEGR